MKAASAKWTEAGESLAGGQLGRSRDDSRVHALELGLEAGGTCMVTKSWVWGREHSARSQGTHSLLPQVVLFATFRTGGHVDGWEPQ